MLKGKLKLPDKARRVFPDRLGSLVSGLEGKDDENGVVDPVFESGEELEILHPDGAQLDEETDNQLDAGGKFVENVNTMEKEETKVRKKLDHKDGQSQILAMKSIAADEKRSDLEHENEINLEKLKRIASTGIPQGGGLRATTWKLLLGYLPSSRDLWEKELLENRQKYAKLKEELLSSPSELNKLNDDVLGSVEVSALTEVSGPLKRHGISHEDHPLSVGKASPWCQYFQQTEIADQIDRDLQRTHPDMKFFSGNTSFSKKNRDAMRNILLLFAKLNPAIRYVQGMNEVLAPIFYVFSTDPDEQNSANAEADSFSCFVRLLSDSVDHFCQQLDNSPVGILSTLDQLTAILKANDEELWRHLEFTTEVRPQFYGFRWITLLLTQEFEFRSILRIWDSLLSNPSGIQDMLLRICCAMLICAKNRLLNGDFATNLQLLQNYPDIDIEHLIQVARDLSPDTNSYPLSL